MNPSNHDIFLNVPYEEKDEARVLGAKWFPRHKSWFIPPGTDPTPFAKWLPPELDQTKWKQLPVRDPPLYIDLVPSSCWHSNLRNELPASIWSAIKKQVSRASNCRCEVCGGGAGAVEAHERFSYDDATSTQILIGVSGLCEACHRASHMGFANATGRGNAAMRHLAIVNKWTEQQADQHAADAFRQWEIRSQKPWRLDLSWLLVCGLALSPATLKKINDPTRTREFAAKKIQHDGFSQTGHFPWED